MKNPRLKLLKICSIGMSIGMLFSASHSGDTSTLAIEPEQSQFLSDSLSRSIKQNANNQPISTLVNGNYQFCTEPPPSDWRSGAGVCFYFTKISDCCRRRQAVRVSGYYG